MGKLRGLFVALVLLGLLTACSGIPTSGPVIPSDAARSDQEEARQPYVLRQPDPPTPGAEPAELVEDFLKASVSYASDVTTVREYLTPAAAKKWEPSDGATVAEGRPEVEVAANGSDVTLSYTATATTNANGVYEAVPVERRRAEQLDLKLSKVDDEWRIAEPPDGVLMSEGDFEYEFRRYYRYFFDPTFQILVPEPIYLAKAGNPVTLLAKSLLSGPSSWLEPAVETAFPDGTELAVPSVTVARDGTAEVELTSGDSPVNADKREQMAAQLAWTLTQPTGDRHQDVAEVNVTLDGGPLLTEAPLVRADFDGNDYSAGRDSRLYALDDRKRLVAASAGGEQYGPVPGQFGSSTDSVEFAVDHDGSQAVSIDSSHTRVQQAALEKGAELETINTGSHLSSLAWDPTGLIWMLDDDGGGPELRAMRSDGTSVTVTMRDRMKGEIDTLSVSPDGAKIAIVADGAAYAGVIVRTGTGADVAGLKQLDPAGGVLDVAWSDPTTVALLTAQSNEDPEPILVELASREVTRLGALPQAAAADAYTIAAGLQGSVVVGTSASQIWANSGYAQWTRLEDGTAPASAG